MLGRIEMNFVQLEEIGGTSKHQSGWPDTRFCLWINILQQLLKKKLFYEYCDRDENALGGFIVQNVLFLILFLNI
jgi:hypothetical protein